jgi:tetratricopeptide (TPR) repeat protein
MSMKKTFGLILVISGFALIALTGIRTVSNPDLFTHIALGMAPDSAGDPISYTMADQNWIDLHPLYNNIAAALWGMGGAPLITLVHVALLMAAFIMMFRFGKDWGGPLSQGLALLLCAWLLQPVFAPGPDVFALLFTALFVTLLYRLKNFNVLAGILLVLQVLWTNMHPSFLFGPALILFFAAENLQATRTASRTSMVTPLTGRLFGLAIASLLITLANPNFINLHTHILTNWALLTGTEGMEWISLFSSGFPQNTITSLTIFSLILGAGGLITLQKKLPPAITLLAMVGAFMTVRSIGALQAFTVLALPFMILSFNAVSEYITRSAAATLKANEKLLTAISGSIVLILMVLTAGTLITNQAYAGMGSASSFGLGLEEEAFPVAAAGLLERDDFPEKIINISHDGGYLFMQNPERKIFCDTRVSLYGEDFYKTLNSALLGRPGAWQSIMADWTPHGVVLNGAWPDSGALANRLVASRRWKLVYFDGATVILVRDLPEYQTLINDPTIQQYGLKVLEDTRKSYVKGSQGLFQPGNSSRLIGAGGIYLALNRPREAEAIYRALTRGCPDMATAWLGLGQSLILQKKLSEGIGYMEQAAAITPRSSRIWMALYQAYRLKGDEAKTAEAVEKLNKFFQAEEATVEQQEAAENKNKPVEKELPQRSGEPTLPKELQ